MAMAAVRLPFDAGPKCPWMVQFAPAATLVPQLLENTHEEASAPVNEMMLMDRAEAPAFVSVTDCEALVDPTFTVPNDRLVADSFTTGAAKPVPLRAIDCGEPLALSVMWMAADRRPVATGPKCP